MGAPLVKFFAFLGIIIILLVTTPTVCAWSFFKAPPPPDSSDSKVSLEDVIKTVTEANVSEEFNSYLGEDPNDTIKPFVSYFHALPEKLTKKLISSLKQIIFYKPPVGIVTVYLLLKLLLKRRKLVESMMMDRGRNNMRPKSSRKQRRRIGRSLDLDKADVNYDRFGGIDAVRAQLCIAALCEYTTQAQGDGSDNIETKSLVQMNAKKDFPYMTFAYYATAARDALEKYSSPKTSREHFVEMAVGPMERLEKLHKSSFFTSTTKSSRSKSGARLSKGDELISILWTAARVAEIRTLDALLRVLRERLLTSAMRLSRKEKLRAIKLGWYDTKRIMWFRRTFKGKTLADDRRNYQLTTAALKREMFRLGQVQQILLSRPDDLSETRLLTASSLTVDEIVENPKMHETNATRVDCAGQIDSSWARNVLLSEGSLSNSEGGWSIAAHYWTRKSRELIRDLVIETYSVVDQNKRISEINSSLSDDLRILSKWTEYDTDDNQDGWRTALSLVDDLSKARLLRESKYLPSLIDLRYWASRLDVFGIPSTLTKIGIAMLLHESIKPFSADIIRVSKLIVETLWGIIEFRFWAPLRYITLDLLNKRPKLLDPFSLGNEEALLDNMLRDLGYGDGTKANRAEALAAASKMYEEEVAYGAITNLFRGNIVNLLLVQIQQLKAGMLEAMGSIDDLVDSNRLNIQLFAVIPAFLLISFSTQLFFAALYSLRSGQFGLSDAHSEMGDILSKMERCLLLASRSNDKVQDTVVKGESDPESATNIVLQPKELGNFVLLIHSYLVILDYCCPPFTSKACDSIHDGMQDLLLEGQLITRRQIALLQLLKSKHSNLMN